MERALRAGGVKLRTPRAGRRMAIGSSRGINETAATGSVERLSGNRKKQEDKKMNFRVETFKFYKKYKLYFRCLYSRCYATSKTKTQSA